MDIARPDQSKAKRKKRLIYGGVAAAVLIGITFLLSRLKPAAPTVDRNLVYIDTVKRGQMLRNVRGLGALVPEEIRWIAARTQGRVDKIILRPGAVVTPDSVILMLTNPDVEQAAANAASQLKAAEAELANLSVTLQSGVIQAESVAASANADYQTSELRAQGQRPALQRRPCLLPRPPTLQGHRRAGRHPPRHRAKALRLRQRRHRPAALRQTSRGRPPPRPSPPPSTPVTASS